MAKANTPLVIFNPGRRGARRNPEPITKRTKISAHVQAIAYRHIKDGADYVHGFGNAELNEKDLEKGWLDLGDLKQITNVEMYYNPDGTITIVGTHGQSLAALFE